MQFNLLRAFIGIAIVGLFLATLTADSWRLSLVWLATLVLATFIDVGTRAYRLKSWERVVSHVLGVLAVSPWGAIIGFVGGIAMFNGTGWFPGYGQCIFAGIALLVVVGFCFPRFMELAIIIGPPPTP